MDASQVVSPDPKIRIRGLGKTFEGAQKVVALDNIDLDVRENEFVTLVGASGCGKSTLLRIIGGLEYHTSGSVVAGGRTVSGAGADRAMVFQHYSLYPWLDVMDNIRFSRRLRVNRENLTSADVERASGRAEALLNLMGLSSMARAFPSQLSGGMQQRVAIARALMPRPEILLMDEPFGALDAQTRSQMQSYLLQIWKNLDITILFITHDLDEAAFLADRILVLKANPGEVNEIIEVPVPRPRTPAQFVSPEFIATKYRIDHLIHPEAAHEMDSIPFPRMTVAGDDVE